MTHFKLSEQYASGHKLGEFVASYSDLRDLFGEPNSEADGYKVSTEWVLEDENGEVIYIGDWKETNLYDEEYPTVEQFRNQISANWSIGGTDKDLAYKLLNWLRTKITSFR